MSTNSTVGCMKKSDAIILIKQLDLAGYPPEYVRRKTGVKRLPKACHTDSNKLLVSKSLSAGLRGLAHEAGLAIVPPAPGVAVTAREEIPQPDPQTALDLTSGPVHAFVVTTRRADFADALKGVALALDSDVSVTPV